MFGKGGGDGRGVSSSVVEKTVPSDRFLDECVEGGEVGRERIENPVLDVLLEPIEEGIPKRLVGEV